MPTDREKREQLAKDLAEFQQWQRLATSKGWKLPGNSPLPNSAWLDYWKACADYERDPSTGRPVIPHRSGGGQPFQVTGERS